MEAVAMTLSEVLDLASKTLTVLVAIGGAIGFLFRTWISEWIKGKVAKAVAVELEDHRSKLNIELESHKSIRFEAY